jgi:tripartite-type tricarboxylate transporter receptor subunit TctC
MKRRIFTSLLLTGLLGGIHMMASANPAADFPKAPIKIVVNFPAGGTVDALARIVGQKLSEKWGQPVIIDNRPGAGGNIGATIAYTAEPDGYTLLASPPGPLSINQSLYKKLQFDATKFAPITMLALIPNVISARADFPASSAKELIAYAKANPGKVTYGSQGNGSTSHLSGQMLANMGSVNLTHIPYKGEGPALTDLIAGRVDLFVGNISAVVKFKEEKKVKFFAVANTRRAKVAPDTPTAAEAGLPEFEASAWFALVAPPGTPDAITKKIHGAVIEALKLPDVQQKVLALGGEVVGNSPKELAHFMAVERARWKKVIDTANVTLD